MQQETLRATKRETAGSRASKRLRRDGRVPGVVYGTDIDATAIHVSARELYSVLHTEAGLNAIIEVDIDGESILTVAREVYRHPVRGEIDHLDFIQVRLDVEIEADVSLDFVGTAIGVIEEEGILHTLEPTVSIAALPNAIPSSIEIDISDMKLHDTLTVADLPEIEGVVYVTDADHAIVTVSMRAAEIIEEPDLLEGEEAEEGAEGEEGEGAEGEGAEGEGAEGEG
ncbi:MAG: 50S ribosomal protein L25/general stress protein Ctc [Acidimicrobiia bacterium]|nr:MAG: 50S ribosomal protein L25/general stress protein Ctc [Acidimicrobiia bacterium]